MSAAAARPGCGTVIATARKRRGLSQQDLAAKVGVSRNAIAQWETNRAFPATCRLMQLSEVLDVDTNTLISPASHSNPVPTADPAPALGAAFAIRHLSVLAYANGFTLWHYKAPRNSVQEVRAVNFFQDAANMLAAGDILMISACDGAGMVSIASCDHSPGGAPVRVVPLS